MSRWDNHRVERAGTMVFVAPNIGTANITVDADEITIIAAAIASMSYDIEAGPGCIDNHQFREMKMKAIHACLNRSDEFNALSARLGKVALVMETREGT